MGRVQADRPSRIVSASIRPGRSHFYLEEAIRAGKIEALFEHKAAPYVAEVMKMKADTAYDRAFVQYPHLVDYKQEVDGIIAQQGLVPAQVADPRTWATLSNHILLTHRAEIAAKEADAVARRKPAPPVSEAGDVKGRRAGARPKSNLTSEQRDYAKLLGVSPEEAELFATMEDE